MTNIVVCGVAGRMGQRLAHLSLAAEDLQLVGGKEHPAHMAIARDIGEIIGAGRLDLEVRDSLAGLVEADRVVVNFTTPEATLKDAAICAEHGTAMVVGTTGFTPEQLEEFKRIVSGITCVFASNLPCLSAQPPCVSMYLLGSMESRIWLMPMTVVITGPPETPIIVAEKRRMNSALTLAERAAAGLDRNLREVVVHGREGVVGARTKKEIGMHAIRGGDIAGEHSVLYAAPGEYIELKHLATSRDSFALGALRAARFAATAEPGLYSMGDVLGLS